MRIAFYAPMKSPDDHRPSGDRTVARALIEAMRLAGHTVEIASRFSSYDRGDRERQRRIERCAAKIAERIARRERLNLPGARYDLWFTYHLYHKAPDLLGPAVSRSLGVPYVVAEASVADKQAGGRWDRGYRASIEALRAADLLIGLNPADEEGVGRHRLASTPTVALPPFVDTRPFADAAKRRAAARTDLAARHGLDPTVPWLVAGAMMRQDQKLASYRLLAQALAVLDDRRFVLLLVGDGPARGAVEAAFAPLRNRVVFEGAVEAGEMPTLYAACDLYVWPAIKEAWSMSLLEAQAAGLPAVAGRSGGVANVVKDGVAGVLVDEGDVDGFAGAVRSLLDDPSRRLRLAAGARRRMVNTHDIAAASHRLDAVLGETLARHRTVTGGRRPFDDRSVAPRSASGAF